MFKRYSRKSRSKKVMGLPLFTVALLSCYLVITVIFFVSGMSEGPGRIYPDAAVSPTPPESINTPVPPTPTADPNTNVIVYPLMPPAVKAKGIYYNVWFPEDNALARCIELIESSELNTVVIDVKVDAGRVTIKTDNAFIPQTSLMTDDQFSRVFGPTDYDTLAEAVADIKSRNIYSIARVVCFKDDLYGRNNPDAAIKNKQGGVWRDNNDDRWLNPHNRDNWEYIAAICREAAKIGFDEIQLDYVRFPLEGRLGDIDYGSAAEEATRYQVISEFVAFIRDEMAQLGVRTSADIFGISAISDRDAGHIGQNVQYLLASLDYISPMIYPSHFANSSSGTMGNGVGQTINGELYTHPDTVPYDVIYNSLQHFTMHIDRFKEENPGAQVAVIRPFLQYFTASYLRDGYWIPYGPVEVRAQIDAVYAAGYEEWLLWSNTNTYSPDLFP